MVGAYIFGLKTKRATPPPSPTSHMGNVCASVSGKLQQKILVMIDADRNCMSGIDSHRLVYASLIAMWQ